MKPARFAENKAQVATPNFKSWFGKSKVVDGEGNPLQVYHGSPDISEFEEFRDEFLGIGNDQYGAGFYFTDDPYLASGYSSDYPKTGGTGSKGVIPVYLRIENPIVLDNEDSINHYPLTPEQAFELIKLAPNVYDVDLSPIGNFIDVWSAKKIDDRMIKSIAKDYSYTISTMRGDFYPDDSKAFLKALQQVTGHDGVIAKFRGYAIYTVFDGKQVKSSIGNSGKFDPDSAKLTDNKNQVETPEFKKWFGNSTMVDGSGNPLVLYHGTTSDFDEFQSKDGNFYFARTPKVALGAERGFIDPDDYKDIGEIPANVPDGINVIPVYLRIENPATIDDLVKNKAGSIRHSFDKLKELGFDGYVSDYEVVVFDSKQIKSAIGNNGDFNPDSAKLTDNKNQVNTPEFKNWFGNSQAVDDNGNPLVLYHGSNADFSEFSIAKLGQSQDFGFAGAGFYFMDNPEWASAYAEVGAEDAGSAVVYPVFLKMENPLELNDFSWFGGIPANAEEAMAIQDRVKNHGYDSIIIRGKQGNPSEFVVFEPTQIKSATGNNGDFNSNSGDITENDVPRYRKPNTPEFKNWYGHSRVPKVVYHFTGADFDEFDTTRSDLGSHFGNLAQASFRADLLTGRPGDTPNIMPVWLSIQNPLRLKDTGSFHADAIAKQLVSKGIIDRDYAKRMVKEIEADWKKKKHYDAEVVQAIKKAGYDGVVYKNQHEGDGDSWIIFDPNQAKSAIGNNGSFDSNSPKVTEDEEIDREENLKRWFGNSKITNPDGSPMVVYHSVTFGNFDSFDKSKQAFGKAGFGFYFSNQSGANVFADYADKFQAFSSFDGTLKSVNIMPCYIKMENPLVVDHVDDLAPYLDKNQKFGVGRGIFGNLGSEELTSIQKAGYDGIITSEIVAKKVSKKNGLGIMPKGSTGGREFPVYVVFEPNQIKSATGNNGNFDPNSDSITESSITAYHGTSSGGFDAFKPNYRRGEQLGFGIHFTTDEEFARRYAFDDKVARKGKSPMVYKVSLELNNVLDLDQIVKEGSPEFELGKKVAGRSFFPVKDEDGKLAIYLQNAIDSSPNHKRTEKLIRDAGYDSVKYVSKIRTVGIGNYYASSGEAESYVVFEPSQVKIVDKISERIDQEPNPGPGGAIMNKRNAVSSLVPHFTEDTPFSSSPAFSSSTVGSETLWEQDGAYFLAQVIAGDEMQAEGTVGVQVTMYKLQGQDFEKVDDFVTHGISSPSLDYLDSLASEISEELRSSNGMVLEKLDTAAVWSSLEHPVRRFWTKKQAFSHYDSNKSKVQPLIAMTNGTSHIVVHPDDAKSLRKIGYSTLSQQSLTESRSPFRGSYDHWRSMMQARGARFLVKDDVELAKVNLKTIGKWYPTDPSKSWTSGPETGVVEASKYPLLRTPVEGEPLTYDVVGYHSTNLDNWASISRYGLIPGKSAPSGQDWAGTWSGKAIYYHLSFPVHELDSSYDPDTGEPFSLVIETRIHNHAGYFVPDEDVSSDVDVTPDVIADKGSVAVGYSNPSGNFIKIHMIDTESSRAWAKANIKRWPVEFHEPLI